MQQTLDKTTVRMCVQTTVFKKAMPMQQRHPQHLSPRRTEGLTHREFTSSRRYLPFNDVGYAADEKYSELDITLLITTLEKF